MDACLNKPRVFRAAAVAMMGLAMICGLLILFSGIALPVSAAPLAATVVITEDITIDATWTTGNVYIVSTDTVAVRDGAKLTIEPGVGGHRHADQSDHLHRQQRHS
jgi:hypothetical protein